MSPELNLYYHQLTRQVERQYDEALGRLSGAGLSTPDRISQEASDFCLGIVPGSSPLFVESEPLPGFPPNHCYEAVERKIEVEGGTKALGWIIWEWSGVMLEAERHAVWKSPEGDFLDVSPKADRERSILFLPDPEGEDDGGTVESRRMPLRPGRLTDDLFKLIAAEQALLRLNESAEIEAAPDKEYLGALIVIKIVVVRMLASSLDATSPCACESGEIYSECHGRAVDSVAEHFNAQEDISHDS